MDYQYCFHFVLPQEITWKFFLRTCCTHGQKHCEEQRTVRHGLHGKLGLYAHSRAMFKPHGLLPCVKTLTSNQLEPEDWTKTRRQFQVKPRPTHRQCALLSKGSPLNPDLLNQRPVAEAAVKKQLSSLPYCCFLHFLARLVSIVEHVPPGQNMKPLQF